MRCSTPNEVSYANMKERYDEVPEVGKLFGIKPFSSVGRRVKVVRGNYIIEKFTYPRHWARQRLNINIFAPDFQEALRFYSYSYSEMINRFYVLGKIHVETK